MELDTITMPRAEARTAFLHYRRAVRERHDAEDEAIMRGYRELSQGRQIIDLLGVIRKGGEDDQGRPRLAVARADVKRVNMCRWADGRVVMGENLNTRSRKLVTNFPADTLPRRALPVTTRGGRTLSAQPWANLAATAIAPNIPPQLRPAHALSNYHVLWEAEWERVPPRDPALLKHLGGWLYVVLATWDLTEIERTVLGLTRAA